MNKKELISQLTSLVEGYTDGLISANNKLFHSGQRLTAEKQEWEQKYHSAMAANKRLDEQNESLQVEKQALLDVIFEWKNDNLSLTALNATLSEELGVLKKEDQLLTKTAQNWQGNYTSIKHELDLAQQELAEDNAEKLRLHCLLQSRTEELAATEEKREEAEKIGSHWFGEFKKIALHCEKLKTDFEAAEERYEEKKKEVTKLEYQVISAEERYQDLQDEFEASKEKHEEFQKKSHGILATLEENLQKKQETIEALTVWKTGAEEVLDTLEASVKQKQDKIDSLTSNNEILAKTAYNLQAQLEALKQINSFQEHRIEVLSRKANKMRKKEQND